MSASDLCAGLGDNRALGLRFLPLRLHLLQSYHESRLIQILVELLDEAANFGGEGFSDRAGKDGAPSESAAGEALVHGS